MRQCRKSYGRINLEVWGQKRKRRSEENMELEGVKREI